MSSGRAAGRVVLYGVAKEGAVTEESGLTLFQTGIGRCGLTWTQLGVAGVSFPNDTDEATRQCLRRRSSAARETTPSAEAANAIGAIVALLSEGRGDLSAIRLDVTGLSAFQSIVYAAARAIPVGAVSTYGAVAAAAGYPGQAREVGRAMGQNPFPIIVPCHRVVAADGSLGGFSAPRGVAAKVALLNLEKAQLEAEPSLFDHLVIAPRPRSNAV